MKRKFIKIASLSLASLMMLTSVPTYADYSEESVTYQTSDEEDFSTETSVLAEIGSEYSVTIPKVIVLSGVTKSANYYVKVEGDIAGLESVNVVPDDTGDLYSNNKSVQVGTITQDKTSWQYNNFDIDANGNVTADGITAGKWSGTFNFNINLASDENTTILEMVLGDLILPPIGEWGANQPTAIAKFEVGESGSVSSLYGDSFTNDITLTSSNEEVVKIENNRLVAVAPGVATITATNANDETFTFEMRVNNAQCEHIGGDIVMENVNNASCTTNGSHDEVTYCVNCGKELSRIHVEDLATGHVNAMPVQENIINATCKDDGSYDEVIYCAKCGTELSRNNVTIKSTGHIFNSDGICTKCGKADLSKMSYSKIQEIAREGKTAEYGIEVGDSFSLGSIYKAEIVNINSNSIMVAPNGCSGYFYNTPQVSDTVLSNKIGYPSSDIRTKAETWFDSLPNNFKAIVKETTKTYDYATLKYDKSGKYYTITPGQTTLTSKVHVASKNDVLNYLSNFPSGYTSSSGLFSNLGWTSTIETWSGKQYGDYAYGRYITTYYGNVSSSSFGNSGSKHPIIILEIG